MTPPTSWTRTKSQRSGVRMSSTTRPSPGALAKWGLNFVIEEYLPRKLDNRKSFLP